MCLHLTFVNMHPLINAFSAILPVIRCNFTPMLMISIFQVDYILGAIGPKVSY